MASVSLKILFIFIFITGFSPLVAGFGASAYVPVEDPVYEFLEICAARAIVPTWSVNSRPITRSAVAGLLETIAGFYPDLDDRILEADLEYFRREFAYDIAAFTADNQTKARTLRLVEYDRQRALNNPHWHAAMVQKDDFNFIFDPLISFRVDADQDKTIFRRATGIQFRGDFKRRVAFSFRFVDRVERGNAPYLSRSALLEDRYGYVGPLQGGNETYYDLTEATLSTSFSSVDLSFGKDRVSWGPFRDEGLLLSGSAPSFTHLRLDVGLFDRLRYFYLIGALNAWDAPGDTLYTTEQGWTRLERPQKWLAAHRVEYMPLEWLVLAVNESIIWGDRGLDPAYLNPINFYYSAEHDGGDHDNILISGDFLIKIRNRGFIYGELLVDDIKLSTLGKGNPGNRIGFAIGGKFLNTGIDGVTAGLDYIRLEPYVYSHFFPVNRYTTWTSNLGNRQPSNSDKLSCWIKFKPRRNIELSFTGAYHRQGDVGSSPFEPLVRNGREKIWFLNDESESFVSTSGSINWEPYPGLIVQTGWLSGEHKSLLPDRFFLGTAYRF